MTKITMFTNELSLIKWSHYSPNRTSQVFKGWLVPATPRPRQLTHGWTTMTCTPVILIMEYCLAWLDVVINLLPRRVAPSPLLLVLNWRSVESANKDRFDNVQTWNCLYGANKHLSRFPSQMTPVIKEFVVVTEDENVVRLRSVSSLRLRLLVKMEKSQVISPAASSQTRPPAVRAMMVFIAGWLIITPFGLMGVKKMHSFFSIGSFYILTLPLWQFGVSIHLHIQFKIHAFCQGRIQ